MQHPDATHVYALMFPLTREPAKRKIHWLRDGAAAGHVLWVFAEMGFRREADLANVRAAQWPAAMLADGADRHMLVMGTRPPISDGDVRKLVPRSRGPIENAILNRLLAYFCFLDRSRVILTREMADRLESPDLADIEFVMYGRPARFYRDIFAETAALRRVVRKPTSNKTTYAYVVRDQLWTGGPQILSFFGVDGEATLAFAHLLRTRHADLLDGRGLSIVKLKGTIPPRATSLAFVDDWESTLRLTHAATSIPPPPDREAACREAPRCGPDFTDAFHGRYGVRPAAHPRPMTPSRVVRRATQRQSTRRFG